MSWTLSGHTQVPESVRAQSGNSLFLLAWGLTLKPLFQWSGLLPLISSISLRTSTKGVSAHPEIYLPLDGLVSPSPCISYFSFSIAPSLLFCLGFFSLSHDFGHYRF